MVWGVKAEQKVTASTEMISLAWKKFRFGISIEDEKTEVEI